MRRGWMPRCADSSRTRGYSEQSFCIRTAKFSGWPLDWIGQWLCERELRFYRKLSDLPNVPAVVLNDRGARRAAHGNELTPEDLTDPSAVSSRSEGGSAADRWRLMDGGGKLLGIAESRPGGLLHPVIVLV